jgi:carboxymethylenebutenolidase
MSPAAGSSRASSAPRELDTIARATHPPSPTSGAHMPDIDFPTGAGSAPGYLAVPDGDSGPATIVLQEWWGVDEHIRSICDRLAAEGFYALAPDLYRGQTTDQPSEAQQKMMALSMGEAEQDMCGAADYLASQPGFQGPGVGAVGFCLGGGLAVWAAASCPNIAAAVTYYYVMPHGKPDFSGIKGPVLGHFGTADEFVSVEAAQALEAEISDAGADVTFHLYEDAGHAFFNDTNRLGTFDPELAQTSWERTVEFLRSALAS